jgi:hypothetical protein
MTNGSGALHRVKPLKTLKAAVGDDPGNHLRPEKGASGGPPIGSGQDSVAGGAFLSQEISQLSIG